MFTNQDETQIINHGLTMDTVNKQVEYFQKGFPPAQLEKPAIVGDGILRLDESKIKELRELYRKGVGEKVVVKFVPASGAASRMFKKLFAFSEEYTGSDSDYEILVADQGKGSVYEFLKNLEQFAFYGKLKDQFESQGESLSESHVKKEYKKIVDKVLTEEGLNYGSLPKGLLQFHEEDGNVRTPVEEHIVEGCQYAKSPDGSVQIHFTVSPEHMDAFKTHASEIKGKYESAYDCKLLISYSVQNPGTDTIAVTPENEPFRNADGSLLFRPAGHGALLENLNDIDADVVFLKNIDNVVPDRLKEETIKYKEVLGGVLLKLQAEIAQHLQNMDSLSTSELSAFAEQTLGFKSGKDLSKDEWINVLRRPIRVCGMVKNLGEPGGGPFWVKDSDGNSSLQIVETAQVDLNNVSQSEILKSSTHFNPVDVVCAVKDHEGNKFDLMNYRDSDAGFDTEKSKDGKTLKAQELPGLWNGSMAYWNTAFVEVPIITFNPVKTVNDLLKAEHQGKV